MARYKGPVCRKCRREGSKLYLKGQRCYGPKCSWEKRQYPPGQNGENSGRRRPTDFAIQLREKQKLRTIYGVLEKPFRKYIAEADRMEGVAGENLLWLLERRLDNLVYRAGMAASRKEARQLVAHGHFTVNGHMVNVASYLVRPGDTLKAKDRSKDIAPIAATAAAAGGRPPLPWLQTDLAARSATLVARAARSEIDTEIDEQMIIEFYSR
jgi:small subunit ribosomal protein S4